MTGVRFKHFLEDEAHGCMFLFKNILCRGLVIVACQGNECIGIYRVGRTIVPDVKLCTGTSNVSLPKIQVCLHWKQRIYCVE